MVVKVIEKAEKVEISADMQQMAKNLRVLANEIEAGTVNGVAYAAVYVPEDETIHRLHSFNYLTENCAGFSLVGCLEKLKHLMVRKWIDNDEANDYD